MITNILPSSVCSSWRAEWFRRAGSEIPSDGPPQMGGLAQKYEAWVTTGENEARPEDRDPPAFEVTRRNFGKSISILRD
ncbi:hypothetical protein NXC14_CH03095 [Rhizobium sp. NXC14]|nr:hypothetical protein NXC14_CH03095 [Rhizobium sp. NXC14]